MSSARVTRIAPGRPSSAPDDASVVRRIARPGATYARSRLRLGVVCVGTLVVLSGVLLALDVPRTALPEGTSWAPTDVAWLALLVSVYCALAAPFDLLGGLVLPRRYGRPVVSTGFGRAWARAVVAHGACLLVAAIVLLGAGRSGGDAGAVIASLLLAVVLLAAQVPIARLVGGVSWAGDRLAAEDPSFVGGIVGLPGRDRTVLSASWDEDASAIQSVRREAIRGSGSRALGSTVAVAFDLCGLAVVLLATSASATSVAGIASLSLWMTLWSFLGLLVLPSLSRRAVVEADRSALSAGVDARDLTHALRRLDALQDDEPERSRLVETIFHPVPALSRRISALDAPTGHDLPQPWHTARSALYVSWASLGLLSRAVHCNCGRPALWVLFPGD